MRHDLLFPKSRWIDLQSPSEEELRQLASALSLPLTIVEELTSPSARTRCEVLPEAAMLYLVFFVPATKRPGQGTETEVDLIITPSWVVTVHYDHIDAIHKLRKELEVVIAEQEGRVRWDGVEIGRLILRKLYSSVRHELAAIRSDLETIEAQMYEGKEREMVFALAKSARDLLNVRQAIEPQEVMWRTLEEQVASLPTSLSAEGKAFSRLVRSARRAYREVLMEMKTLTAWLRELRETNNSLVSTKQNEVMQTLTIMAFVTFPLTLVSSIFGMNTKDLPIVGMPGDFWIVLGMMAGMTVAFFWYFWRKGWLR